jgi:hypothetical protein
MAAMKGKTRLKKLIVADRRLPAVAQELALPDRQEEGDLGLAARSTGICRSRTFSPTTA